MIATLAPGDHGIAIDLVAAGHPAPVIVRREGTLEECGGHNPLLGVFPDAVFAPTTVHLTTGDVLVAVTDGVLEARNSDGEFFDETRLSDALRQATRTAAGIADGVHAAVAAFAHRINDDLAIVTVEAT